MIGIYFPITQGKFALVDRGLYEEATERKWAFDKTRGYVIRITNRVNVDRRMENLQQFVIFHEIDSYVGSIDHINRDKLDCRRENLRIGTQSQNGINSEKSKSRIYTSKYKGVSVEKTGRIRAGICVMGNKISLGSFDTEEEAALAYNIAATKYFGEFAYLNVIEESNVRPT